MSIPQALRELDLDALVGMSIEDAIEQVEGAGGHVRAAAAGSAVTAEYRPDRVTLLVEHGIVVESMGIG